MSHYLFCKWNCFHSSTYLLPNHLGGWLGYLLCQGSPCSSISSDPHSTTSILWGRNSPSVSHNPLSHSIMWLYFKRGIDLKPEHLRCDSCLKVWRRLSWNPCTPLVFKSSLLVPSSPHGSKVSKYHTFEKRPLKPDLSFALPYFKGIVLCVCSKKVKRIFNDIKIWWK